ncbi:MAG: PRC and DUF2382 domain-containing protein [Pedobacter sp.]
MALEENKHDHLVELGGSDYEIVDGEPNIKGWDVKNEFGELIGEVDELLFDPQSRQVRYLVVDLNDKVGMDTDKKVLVPIGLAELYKDGHAQDEDSNIDHNDQVEEAYNPSTDGKVVIVPVTTEQLAALPSYQKGSVSPETESTVRDIFSGLGAAGIAAGAVAYNRNEFYTHDHFNENNFYDRNKKLPVIEENLEIGKTQVQTGGARITSRIVERPVEESINLREEHVNVERNPVNRPVNSSDTGVFQEQELELTESAEVPVVDKEARVVEEVHITKNVEEREETIRETLRNTEVEAERIDPNKTKLS